MKLSFLNDIPEMPAYATGGQFLTRNDLFEIQSHLSNPQKMMLDFTPNMQLHGFQQTKTLSIVFCCSGYGEFIISQLIIHWLEQQGFRFIWWITSFARDFDIILSQQIDPAHILKFSDNSAYILSMFSTLCPDALFLIEHSGLSMTRIVRMAAGWKKIPVFMLSAKCLLTKNYIDSLPSSIQIEAIRSFKAISFAVTESETHANQLVELGVEPNRIAIGNSMKWYPISLIHSSTAYDNIRQVWHLSEDELIWIAGSIHPQVELKLITHVFLRLKKRYRLKLIMVPRHSYRNLDNYIALFTHLNTPFCLWKDRGAELNPEYEILLIDAFGDLNSLYSQADIAFVGGSFEPNWNGHNVIEPIFQQIPTVIGPSFSNFNDIINPLLQKNGIIVVHTPRELFDVMCLLITSPSKRNQLSTEATSIMQSYQSIPPLEVALLAGILDQLKQK